MRARAKIVRAWRGPGRRHTMVIPTRTAILMDMVIRTGGIQRLTSDLDFMGDTGGLAASGGKLNF
jgi:hypothetical protein